MSSYESARELLQELGTLARSLTSGLDDVSIANGLLNELHTITPFEIGVVYRSSEEGNLIPLAMRGADSIPWLFDARHDSWIRALDSKTAEALPGSLSSDSGSHVVLPLTLSNEQVGAVVLASTQKSTIDWTDEQLSGSSEHVNQAAIKIDSARLFREVQSVATVEERRRLAREIHDGIAQEIASLGYVVDDIVADTQDEVIRERVLALRGELSRIINELRLSIFDLRSDVQPDTGLGAALSSYIRHVGTTTNLTIHLVLDETANRLDVSVEEELLRIAQESITNTRKHASARNLWATCRIDPPHALLRLADDGVGMAASSDGSYGLDIMRERAARIGANLTIRERTGGGTIVELTLGDAHVDASEAP